VAHDRIAIDPGIGFGKSVEENLALIEGSGRLAATGYPVLGRLLAQGLHRPADRHQEARLRDPASVWLA
jgi:Dihydropteroate synthase and related enzymes